MLAKYPIWNYGTASEALAAVQGDSGRICQELRVTRTLSQFVPVYMYEFGDRTAPSYLEPVTFPLGAYHTGEIQYLFPLYRGATGTVHALNALQERLSDQMVSYWTAFAKSGQPNSDVTPNWPRYGGKYQSLMLPGPVTLPVAVFSAAHRCGFWERLQ